MVNIEDIFKDPVQLARFADRVKVRLEANKYKMAYNAEFDALNAKDKKYRAVYSIPKEIKPVATRTYSIKHIYYIDARGSLTCWVTTCIADQESFINLALGLVGYQGDPQDIRPKFMELLEATYKDSREACEAFAKIDMATGFIYIV